MAPRWPLPRSGTAREILTPYTCILLTGGGHGRAQVRCGAGRGDGLGQRGGGRGGAARKGVDDRLRLGKVGLTEESNMITTRGAEAVCCSCLLVLLHFLI